MCMNEPDFSNSFFLLDLVVGEFIEHNAVFVSQSLHSVVRASWCSDV